MSLKATDYRAGMEPFKAMANKQGYKTGGIKNA